MNPDDEALAIAARIADGSGIDWAAADASRAAEENRGVLNQLRVIASLAALHRAPQDSQEGGASLAGSRWGPLTLIGPIAEGRFGQVYRAWEPRLQRQVALKLLHSTSLDAAESPTRAIEEARLLARVRHPNVLTVYGAECLDGRDLDRIHRGPHARGSRRGRRSAAARRRRRHRHRSVPRARGGARGGPPPS